MLCVVQANASQDVDVVLRKRTEELGHGDNLVRDPCLASLAVDVIPDDNLGLKLGFLSHVAEVKVGLWQDGLAPEGATIRGHEAN